MSLCHCGEAFVLLHYYCSTLQPYAVHTDNMHFVSDPQIAHPHQDRVLSETSTVILSKVSPMPGRCQPRPRPLLSAGLVTGAPPSFSASSEGHHEVHSSFTVADTSGSWLRHWRAQAATPLIRCQRLSSAGRRCCRQLRQVNYEQKSFNLRRRCWRRLFKCERHLGMCLPPVGSGGTTMSPCYRITTANHQTESLNGGGTTADRRTSTTAVAPSAQKREYTY